VLAPDIENLWQRAMKRAMDEKPHLGSYLEAGRVRGGGSDEVVLEYDSSHVVFGEMVSKEENRAYIARLLRDLSQRDVAFRVSASPGPAREGRPAGAAGRTPPGESSSRRQVVSEAMAHPLVKEALDVFGGEVMEVKDMKRATP
jgi:DNA polymerase-3 subunit gamma/tau